MDESRGYHDAIAACDRQMLAWLDARDAWLEEQARMLEDMSNFNNDQAADNQAKRYAEDVAKALQPRPPRPARRKAGPRQRGYFG